jgi:hypothetical protein
MITPAILQGPWKFAQASPATRALSLPAPARGSTICRVIEPQVYSQRGMRLDLYLGRCGLQPGQNAQPRPRLNQSLGESALPCVSGTSSSICEGCVRDRSGKALRLAVPVPARCERRARAALARRACDPISSPKLFHSVLGLECLAQSGSRGSPSRFKSWGTQMP